MKGVVLLAGLLVGVAGCSAESGYVQTPRANSEGHAIGPRGINDDALSFRSMYSPELVVTLTSVRSNGSRSLIVEGCPAPLEPDYRVTLEDYGHFLVAYELNDDGTGFSACRAHVVLFFRCGARSSGRFEGNQVHIVFNEGEFIVDDLGFIEANRATPCARGRAMPETTTE